MPVILFYALAALALVGVGCSVGWKVTSDHYEAKAAKDDRVALEDFQTAVLGMNVLSKALQEKKSDQKILYRTIREEIPTVIDRHVYHNECVDDDGLRLINEALSGGLYAIKHDDALPPTNPANWKDGR